MHCLQAKNEWGKEWDYAQFIMGLAGRMPENELGLHNHRFTSPLIFSKSWMLASQSLLITHPRASTQYLLDKGNATTDTCSLQSLKSFKSYVWSNPAPLYMHHKLEGFLATRPCTTELATYKIENGVQGCLKSPLEIRRQMATPNNCIGWSLLIFGSFDSWFFDKIIQSK